MRDVIDDELAIMEERLSDAETRFGPEAFRAPLGSLMHSPRQIGVDASVQDALDQMLQHYVGALIVVSGETLVGIFGERDILMRIVHRYPGDLAGLPLRDYMTANPDTLREDDRFEDAVAAMARGGYRHVPIVNDAHQPVGMVSVRDVVSYLVEHFLQEILNLPPEPRRHAMKAREGA